MPQNYSPSHYCGMAFMTLPENLMETDYSAIGSFYNVYVVFKVTGRRNYAKESINLLIQYYYTFSERKKAQLLWSRCINTKGYAGANIPCNLYMEHLNRRLKSVIRSMGANVKPVTIERAGKAIASVHRICLGFEEDTTGYRHSEKHPFPSFGKDYETVSKLLREEKVFTLTAGRRYPSFTLKKGLMETQTLGEMTKKVESSIKQMM